MLKKLTQDVWLRWIIGLGFLLALFLCQGIPLFDDDFTTWFSRIEGKSFFDLIVRVLSPISTQPQHWGFNERPVQALLYKVFYSLSGYESWTYFLFKSFVYASMGGMVYLWVIKLAGKADQNAKIAGACAAALLLLAPGPAAAFYFHQDIAPLSELTLLLLTLVAWEKVEKTPKSLNGLPRWTHSKTRQWLIGWLGFIALAYIGYKIKANVKLLPVILGIYVLLVRRNQFFHFLVPGLILLFLAIPWGPGILSKLPPWFPGSEGSQIGWMYQPAKLSNILEFIGSPFLWKELTQPSLALASILGPFLLLGLIGNTLWLRWQKKPSQKRKKNSWFKTPEQRALTLVLIWLGVVLLGTASLAHFSDVFRIRYGIIPLVPTSILVGYGINWVLKQKKQIPRALYYGSASLFFLQILFNSIKTGQHRSQMGFFMVTVDRAYQFIESKYPDANLKLAPGFRPFDYRHDGGRVIQKKEWLKKTDDLNDFAPYKTLYLSWEPSLWPRLEIIETFSSCRKNVLFEWIWGCKAHEGAYLMRYIGRSSLYEEGEKLRKIGKPRAAKEVHEKFLNRHPRSPSGWFVVGLESFAIGDYKRAEAMFSRLAKIFPHHRGILFNHGLALTHVGKLGESIHRFEEVHRLAPQDKMTMLRLYDAYFKKYRISEAMKVLEQLQALYPQDPEVLKRLNATKK